MKNKKRKSLYKERLAIFRMQVNSYYKAKSSNKTLEEIMEEFSIEVQNLQESEKEYLEILSLPSSTIEVSLQKDIPNVLEDQDGAMKSVLDAYLNKLDKALDTNPLEGLHRQLDFSTLQKSEMDEGWKVIELNPENVQDVIKDLKI